MLPRFFLFCLLLLITASPLYAAAQEPESFAVLPFSINGPEKYRYLSQGVQSMLTSRLSWEDRFVPVDGSKIDIKSKDIDSLDKAREGLSALQADYLVWGSMNIMDKQSSLDIKILEKGTDEVITRSSQTALNDLIPSLETMAKQINEQVFDRETETKSAQSSEQEQEQESASEPLNTGFLYNEDSAQQGELNPQIKYSQAEGSSGRWRSQSMPFVGRAMVVGDADADGQNEIFIMEDHKLHAYKYKQNKLALLDTYELSNNIQLLNLNLLDLNRDGYLELVMSALREDNKKSRPHSRILNFKESKFRVKEKNIPYYLGMLRRPPDYKKILIGQSKGFTKMFEPGVHEVLKMSGKYQLGPKLNLPEKATVFNAVYLPQKEDYKIILARNDDLQVYSASKDREYTTEETYAASGIGLEKDMSTTGFGPDSPVEHYYLPTRVLPVNLDQDNRFELLVSRNMSVSAGFFPSYRQFPQGEVHCLYWDGVGLNIMWKTRLIKGTIVDYGIADYDNDGTRELYVCINTHPGTVGLKQIKTLMLGYDLNLED